MQKKDWILVLIILASFIVGVIYYPNIPEQMPMHWNIHGEVDNYMSKDIGVFLFPGINLMLFILLIVLPKIDPRKKNYEQFNRVYVILRWSIVLFFSIIYLATIFYSINDTEDIPELLEISFIVPFLVSILFIIIGNYMGKLKDNFFVGIRTPWTLSSKTVWSKTHRLGGKLFVLSGLLGMIGSFIGGNLAFILLIVPIMATAIFIIIYSYVIFQKETK